MEYGEGDLALPRGVEKADVAQRLQRVGKEARADVNDGDLRVRARQGVEDLHLVGGRGDVDDLGDVRMEALQRATRRLGVERAGRNVVGDEIVQQRARHGRLADAALVRAHQNYRRFGHHPPFESRLGTWSRTPESTRWQRDRPIRTGSLGLSPVLRAKWAGNG